MERLLKIIDDTLSSLFSYYRSDQAFWQRAGQSAWELARSLDSSGMSDKQLRETILPIVDQPQLAWRKYFEWPNNHGYALFQIPNSTGLGRQANPFFKEGTALILSEIEQPAEQRNPERLQIGTTVIDQEIHLFEVYSRDPGAARIVLEEHDVRFKAMTNAMWSDFASYLGKSGPGTKRKSSKRWKSRPPLSDKTKTIRRAIRENVQGLRYCRVLDSEDVRPSEGWIDKGCPPTYVAAYKISKWRIRIQDEKYRVKRNMEKEKQLKQP